MSACRYSARMNIHPNTAKEGKYIFFPQNRNKRQETTADPPPNRECARRRNEMGRKRVMEGKEKGEGKGEGRRYKACGRI